MVTQNFKIVKAFLLLLLVFAFNACTKIETPLPEKTESAQDLKKQVLNPMQEVNSLTGKVTLENRTYFKNVEIPLNNNGSKSDHTSSLTCDGYANTITLVYMGFTDVGTSCGSGDRMITINWVVGYPSAPDNSDPGINPVLNSLSVGKFRLPNMTSTWTTAPLFLSDEIFDEDYACHLPPRGLGYLYKVVSASFTVIAAEYGINNDFDFDMVLQTDCPTYPEIKPLTFSSETFDQQQYREVFYNPHSTASGQFTVTPLWLICTPIHGPQLGLTPLSEFKYRPYIPGNPNNFWVGSDVRSVVFTLPYATVTETGIPPGVYEFKSKYQYLPLGPAYQSRYRFGGTFTVLP